jgi:transcriptional regulator with XRE-family HTH domain
MKNNTSEVRASIGARLRAARETARLTQREAVVGQPFSRQSLSAWERGEGAPDAGELAALVVRYGVTGDQILFGVRNVQTAAQRIIERARERAA